VILCIRQHRQKEWQGSAISGGQILSAVASVGHPGVSSFNSVATADSGYRMTTATTVFLLSGSEKTTTIFKTPVTFTGTTTRIGFLDNISSAAPTDGCYFNLIENILTGNTSRAGANSVTNTTFTLAADTWYRFVIELNSDATAVTFTLYGDDSDVVLFQATLTTNVPVGAGKHTGQGIVSTNSGTTAVLLGTLDYMDFVILKARRV